MENLSNNEFIEKDIVKFEDKAFEGKVKEVLEKTSVDAIYIEDLKKINGILITEGGAGSIGIPWVGDSSAYNMKFPDLRFNVNQSENGMWIKDMQMFDKIKTVHIYVPLEEVSFIGIFKSLEELYISDSTASNWCFIEELISLKFLYVSNSPFSDLKPISNLCKKQEKIYENLDRSSNNLLFYDKLLRNLHLINCGISDITPLKDCKHLSDLNLSHNNISDISSFEEIGSIYYLTLRWNKINDITPLANFGGYYLNLRHNDISDISIFENYKNCYIGRLYLEHNNISNYTPVRNLDLVMTDIEKHYFVEDTESEEV